MILEQIEKDLIQAIKTRDNVRAETLKSIKTALVVAKTAKGAVEQTEDMEMVILQRLVKQRDESATLFIQGGRTELAEKELQEKKIISEYLPDLISEDELESIVTETINRLSATKRDMGKVMNEVKQKISSLNLSVDGKSLAKSVQSKLM